MSDPEFNDLSDQDVSEKHSKLLDSVAQLDKWQRIKKAERSEPSLEVSEFHLVKSGITDDYAVCVQDLAKSLGRKGYQHEITKKLQYVRQKSRVLPKPLEKPAAERIKRAVGFDNVKKDVGRWNSIIAKNRTADRLVFPLKHPVEMKNSPTTEFLANFRIKSDLMMKLDELDASMGPSAEEKEKDPNKYKMTMEEMILRRQEAAKLRAQQSYKEAKAYRQSKIKSKKFHRIQRKDKIKQQLKEFEKLRDSNPQEAIEKLKELDQIRAKERMSLRHRSTGQWAKNKQIQAKYNPEARHVLAGQLSINRELTQKVKVSDDEDEDTDVENMLPLVSNDDNNPWMKTESDIESFIKNYRKYWDEKQQKEEKIEKKKGEKKEVAQSDHKLGPSDENNDTVNSTQKIKKPVKIRKESKTANKRRAILNDTQSKLQDIDEIFDSMEEKLKRKVDSKLQKMKKKLGLNSKTKKTRKQQKDKKEKKNTDSLSDLEFKSSKQRPVLDQPLQETTGKESIQEDTDMINLKIITNPVQELTRKINDHEVEINPNKYLNVKEKYIKTQIPDIDTAGYEENEEEDEIYKIMSEAFADDDVVEEFRKEKEEEKESKTPQEIDLNLPGWGSWAGPAVNEKQKRKKKSKMFIMNVPKEASRRDENNGKVIIFEDGNENLRKHRVSELPYPFSKVEDFEASLRAPITRAFVSENAHSRLIQRPMAIKLGQVIKPMNEDELLKNQPIIKKPLKRNIDKKNTKKNTVKNKKKRI